jgi:hypothetical protein
VTLVLIKAECPHHRGRFTLGEPCDLCASETFERAMRADTARFIERVTEILAIPVSEADVV